MLKEIENPRQVQGEPRRKWFSDSDSDLIIWIEKNDVICGFQLCYGKGKDEHALTWRSGSGFLHERIDDGEGRPFHYKSTPVLSPGGTPDVVALTEDFRKRSVGIDPNIIEFVLQRLAEYA